MSAHSAAPLARDVEPVAEQLLRGEKIQPGHPLFGIVWINANRVSGAPCFHLTRVPLQNLFDSLAADETLDEFLDGFEGVKREQATAVLSLPGRALFDQLAKA